MSIQGKTKEQEKWSSHDYQEKLKVVLDQSHFMLRQKSNKVWKENASE